MISILEDYGTYSIFLWDLRVFRKMPWRWVAQALSICPLFTDIFASWSQLGYGFSGAELWFYMTTVCVCERLFEICEIITFITVSKCIMHERAWYSNQLEHDCWPLFAPKSYFWLPTQGSSTSKRLNFGNINHPLVLQALDHFNGAQRRVSGKTQVIQHTHHL